MVPSPPDSTHLPPILRFGKGLLGQRNQLWAFLGSNQALRNHARCRNVAFVSLRESEKNNLFCQAPSEVVVNIVNFSSPPPRPSFIHNSAKSFIPVRGNVLHWFEKNLLLKQNCGDSFTRKPLLICYLSNCFCNICA